MKICFPVVEANGIDSEVHGHFGSATAFIVVESEGSDVETIHNPDQQHEHGACNPLQKFNNHKIDALVVAGIGGGALNKLNQAGIRVFKAISPSVKENIRLLQSQALPEFTVSQCCPGHGQNMGCQH